MNRAYELVVLLHPDLEIDLDKPLAKIRKIITEGGGEIIKEDNWGKRKLAYPVKEQDFAVYTYFELSLPVESVKKISSILNITEEVIRYLLTAVDPKAVAAAKRQQERADGEEAKETEKEEKDSQVDEPSSSL